MFNDATGILKKDSTIKFTIKNMRNPPNTKPQVLSNALFLDVSGNTISSYSADSAYPTFVANAPAPVTYSIIALDNS